MKAVRSCVALFSGIKVTLRVACFGEVDLIKPGKIPGVAGRLAGFDVSGEDFPPPPAPPAGGGGDV